MFGVARAASLKLSLRPVRKDCTYDGCEILLRIWLS